MSVPKLTKDRLWSVTIILGQAVGILFVIEIAIFLLREIFLRNLIRGSSSFWIYFDLFTTTLFEVILVGVAVVVPLAAISRYLKSKEDKSSD